MKEYLVPRANYALHLMRQAELDNYNETAILLRVNLLV